MLRLEEKQTSKGVASLPDGKALWFSITKRGLTSSEIWLEMNIRSDLILILCFF